MRLSPIAAAPRRDHLRRVAVAVSLSVVAALPIIATPAMQAEAAAPTATAGSAKDLPALASAPSSRPTLSTLTGDFSDPPGTTNAVSSSNGMDRRGVKPGASLVGRKGKSEVWDNHDGTSTAIVHAQPSLWRDHANQTQPIDDHLVARDSRFQNASGPVAIVVASATGDGDLVTADADGWSLGFAMSGSAAGRTGQVDGSTIRYKQIAAGMDLQEQIEGQNLKETIVFTELPPAGSSGRYRFPLNLQGLTPKAEADGSIGFFDTSGSEVATMPAGIAFDSSGDLARGSQSSTPVHVALAKVGSRWAVDVSVDANWLTSRARVAPIFIDPNLVFNAGRDNGSTHSDAFVDQANPTTNYNGSAQLDSGAYVDKVGYASYPTGQYNGFLQYDVSALAGHSVVSATWNGDFLSAAAYPSTFAVTKAAASWSDSTITWNNQPSVTGSPVTGSVTAANQLATADITSWVQSWVATPSSNYGMRIDSNGTNAYLRLAAMEQAGGQDSSVAVTFSNTAPAIPTQADLSPVDGSSAMTLTPTVTSAAKTDADGDAVKYWFRLATGSDAETGQVVNSAWLTSPSFQIPAGVLQDGLTYYWKVFTWDGWGATPTSGSPVNSLKINLRLGDQGTIMDSAGPVKVNLANGNVFAYVDSPSFQTLGGPIGVSYSYNSQAPSSYGLSGAYYNCTGAAPAFPPTDGTQPQIVRQDTSVSFSWGSGAPASMVGTDNFCVRWSGYLTVPATGTTWSLGASHDDGVRIYMNSTGTGTPYLDKWVDGSTTDYGASLSLTANQPVPITIDFYDHTGTASVSLLAAGPQNMPVPSSWLTPSSTPSGLPAGWSLSTTSHQSLLYNAALIGSNSIALLDQSGASHGYRKVGSAWKSTAGQRAVVTKNSDGSATAIGEDNKTYVFNSAGKLTSVRTSGGDDATTSRTAPTYSYDTTTGALSSIADPLTSRALSFRYGSDAACPTAPTGFDTAAPPGEICQLTYPDSSHTNLFYVAGQLGRIADPGGATTDFAYDGNGRLTKVRDALGYDKVQTSPGTLDNDTTRTVIAYDATSGKATSVTLPVPNAGDTPALSAPAHTYTYPAAGDSRVNLAGLTPASGFSRKVTFDATTGLIATDVDATNHTTSYEWSSDELPIGTTDPAGIKTTTVYDGAATTSIPTPDGRVTDTYGPAPASCFTGQVPNGTCTSPAVPHATTAYDEGIKGLAAAYWNNQTQTGPPIMHATGVGDATGALNKDWVAGTPFDPNWTSPWSGRFTGDIIFPQTGTYTLQLDSDDGVRLFLDDGTSALIDAWYDHRGFSSTATFNNTVAGSRHRIDIEYYDNTQGAKIGLYWTPPGGSQVLVPGDDLAPDYGLVTSKVDADTKKTAAEYSNGSIGPEYGLPTATVADPATLNLRTTMTYEAPGGSGSYLRQLTRTLPKSSSNTVSYAYYTATQAAPTNNCGISSTVQAGLLQQTSSADGVTKQNLYDGLGRLAGTKYSGDANWACTAYDSRGRVASFTDRNLLTMTMDYSTVGQVTTSYTDSSGMARTTVAKVDLLGRLVSYTDELGTTTRTVYDQPGRKTATYRTFAGQSETQLTVTVFDDAGRPTSQTEYASGSGRTTTFGYDSAGRPQTLIRPNGVVTTTGYDTNVGAVATLSNKQGGTTEISPWTYVTSPAGRTTSEATTGRTRAFSYDGAGRLITTNENSGATVRNYAFDADTNRCANATTCGTATFTYDVADRVTASPYASAYGYDAHGSVISTTGTGGNPSMKFGYDANDHATVTNDGTTTTVATLAPSGRVLRRVVITNSTGVVSEDTSLGYDGPGDSPAYSEPTASSLGWPVILNDGFTGANGDAWDSAKWVTTSNDSTKIADLQSNQARLYVNGSPARATSQMTATADAEVNLTYRFNETTSGSFLRIFTRASGATGANQMPNAYRLEVASNSTTIVLQKFVNSVVTQIGSFNYTSGTTAQRIRFQVQGSSIKAKVWAVGTSEPASWSVSATDTAITGTGVVQIAHSHSSGTHTVYVDNLAISTPGLTVSPVVTTYIGCSCTGLLVTDTGGTATYPISTGHGDIVGTTDSTGTYTAGPTSDEFGRGTTPTSRLGYLGTKERFVEQPASGIIRMGVRLYDPNLGRFLAADPVDGGSTNTYDYVGADPVNGLDLSGELRRTTSPFQRWVNSMSFDYGPPVLDTNILGARVVAFHNSHKRPSDVIGILCVGGAVYGAVSTVRGLFGKNPLRDSFVGAIIGGALVAICGN